ncbi:MAG: hypothetical protein H6722_05300 [Sandaracinus sp.]|nr:hypothetical protein [Myxococcales bacterium]MCB9611856.1 hypothetical protein [Sandaracinus sp.]MCB9623600.1 hypothetical protein [Sandaracinus sp.]
MPKRIADDLDVGRILKNVDLEREVRDAVDAVVEAGFEVPLPPRLVLGAMAIVGGVVGGLVWSAAGGSVAFGAFLGLVVGVFPVGFTSQWLGTMALGRAVEQATTTLSALPSKCPSCAVAIGRMAGPGMAKCPSCHTELAVHPEVVVPRAGDRREPLREAVRTSLGDQAFFAPKRLSVGDWALVLGVYVASLGCLAIAKLGAPFVG